MNIIPDYLPLHHNVTKQFYSLQLEPLQLLIDDTIYQFEDILIQLIDQYDNYPKDIIDGIQKNIDLLDSTVNEEYMCNKSLIKAKNTYKSQSDQCDPVSLESWDQYRLQRLHAPSLEVIYKEIRKEQNQNKDDRLLQQWHTLLNSLPFIWDNPTSVIPTDKNEDDLMISGGRIDLTCPITCKVYENPMLSLKCGHVFEKFALVNHLNNQTIKCPQSACGQHVNLNDFVPDLVMKFRCIISSKRSKVHVGNVDNVTL